jgi:regulator of ribosome biosynthesis
VSALGQSRGPVYLCILLDPEALLGPWQVGEDPFTKQRQDKRERVKKQAKQQLGNLKAAVKTGGAGALPPTLRLAAALPEHGKGRPVKRKELSGEVSTF